MSGFGGLNKSANGVVIGLVQLQLPTVVTPADLAAQTKTICDMVAKARRNLGTMDLVVFPEYSLHGLSMDTNPDILCRMDGPEVALFRATCREQRIWGCFSLMELNPGGNPWNTGGRIHVHVANQRHPFLPRWCLPDDFCRVVIEV